MPSNDTLREMISGHPTMKSVPSFAWSFAGTQIGWFTSEFGPQAIQSAHIIWTCVVKNHGGQFITSDILSKAISSDHRCNAEFNRGIEHKKYVYFMLGQAADHYNAIFAGMRDGKLTPNGADLIDTEAYDTWWLETSQGRPGTGTDIKPAITTSRPMSPAVTPVIQVEPKEPHGIRNPTSSEWDRREVLEWLSRAYPDAASGKEKLPKKETVWRSMREEGIASTYFDARSKWHLYVPKEWRRGKGQRERS